jgi:hypothetical protein
MAPWTTQSSSIASSHINNDKIPLLGDESPIRVGGKVIDGIGVGSALDRDKDKACVQTGLDKIQERLR